MTEHVLVTGGAGYIGSHTCYALAKAGFTPVVFDNLSNGHEEFVKWGPFVPADIRDVSKIIHAIRAYRPVGILHFAGEIEVGKSVTNPLAFYQANVVGSLNLLNCAVEEGVKNLVFSSTCATFGLPRSETLAEDHPQDPINPYGWTKLAIEKAIQHTANAGQIEAVILRYFNAAGSEHEAGIGEWHDPESHAIPLMLAAASAGKPFYLNGQDYETRDGTCVRDYVHVSDLADAHVKALRYLIAGNKTTSFNLGSGTGTTLRELIQVISEVTGSKIEVVVRSRRAGDPPALVGDNTRAGKLLNWSPARNIYDIVRSAWAWHQYQNKKNV